MFQEEEVESTQDEVCEALHWKDRTRESHLWPFCSCFRKWLWKTKTSLNLPNTAYEWCVARWRIQARRLRGDQGRRNGGVLQGLW